MAEFALIRRRIQRAGVVIDPEAEYEAIYNVAIQDAILKARSLSGKDLTSGKHFGIIHRLAGDLDWYQNRLKFRLGPSSNLPCCWCDGGRPPHPPFLDLRPQAGWMGTLKTHPQPWASDHPLKDAPGLSLFTLSPELRHS